MYKQGQPGEKFEFSFLMHEINVLTIELPWLFLLLFLALKKRNKKTLYYNKRFKTKQAKINLFIPNRLVKQNSG